MQSFLILVAPALFAATI
jgi:RTA1 like protein